MVNRVRVFEVDTRELDDLAERLGRLDGVVLSKASVQALNTVIDETNEKVRDSITATVNLTPGYLADRLDVGHASSQRLEASIYAPARDTSLGRYFARPTVQVSRSPYRRLKGNPALGIPRGLKQKGVGVTVTKGSRKTMKDPTAFMHPTLVNSSGEPMVFTTIPGQKGKSGKNKLEARYGPAVYQLFRVARDNIFDEVSAHLELTLLAETSAAIEEVF